MDESLLEAIAEVVGRLRKVAQEDARFRVRLQQIGQALIHLGEPPHAEQTPTPAREHTHHHHPEPAPASNEEFAGHAPFSANGNGQHHHHHDDDHAHRGFTRGEFSDEVDLSALEHRCRLKAEAARFAADRRKLMSVRPDVREETEPRHQELIGAAKALPDCFLWMIHADGPEPSNGASYEDVAGCFDAVADAVALNQAAFESPEISRVAKEKALYLLAEAQSALRSAVNRFDGYADPDQTRAFRWLRTKAAETQIYIRRYMRAGDPADPAKWADLSSRIESSDVEVQDAGRKTRLRKKLTGRVRHKASLIADLPDTDAREIWVELSRIVDELITLGTTPGDPELKEFLEPVCEKAPDLESFPFPAGFKLVIRELVRPRQAKPVAENGRPMERDPSGWLRGRAAVLIGGECRATVHAELRTRLELADLFWIETREPIPVVRFEHYVARDEVALVLVSPEWPNNGHHDIAECCRRHAKPMVQLNDGFDVSLVLESINGGSTPERQAAG